MSSIVLYGIADSAISTEGGMTTYGEPIVTLYTDRDFGGNSQELTPGSYTRIRGEGFNDAVSSLRIPAGLRVTLYEDWEFAGRQWTFTADTAYVGDDANDLASSIVIAKS